MVEQNLWLCMNIRRAWLKARTVSARADCDVLLERVNEYVVA